MINVRPVFASISRKWMAVNFSQTQRHLRLFRYFVRKSIYFIIICNFHYSLFRRDPKPFDYDVIQETGLVSPAREVPSHIVKPPYGIDKEPSLSPKIPEIKNTDQISHMRRSCALARKVLNFAKSLVKVVF